MKYGAGVGIMSKFYEVAFISRLFKEKDGSWSMRSLMNSLMHQGDNLGAFIYRPTRKNFEKLISSETDANSTKSSIMFDTY